MLSLLRRVTLTQWILVAMVVGTLVGWLAPNPAETVKYGELLSTIFLRLIKCLIVPLLFSTLVVGIAGHSDDLKGVGRLALRSIIYFEIVTTLALAVGLAAVNLVRPGDGITLDPALAASAEGFATQGQRDVTLKGVLTHMIPQSFAEAAATNDVLQVVLFAILFAVATAQAGGRPRAVMIDMLSALSEIMFKFTNLVMKFAPLGIGGAIAATVAKSGIDVLGNLAMLVGTLYGALAVFVLVVLVPVALLTRVPLGRFVRSVREPALIAFSTASSEAALPLAMERMVELGVPRRIVGFVIPTGYSFNLDGSTLYLAVASIFAAQAAGKDLALSEQLLIMLTLMLTSKGVAAVPRASIVILAGTLATFDLPLAAVGLILGVDALMDMARTSINLVGNCLASVVMARWEGVFGKVEADDRQADLDPVVP